MPRSVIAVLLLATAVQARELQPLIDRPILLRQGGLDLTLHGTYTNWTAANFGSLTLDGETLAVSADYGVTDRLQLGLGVAFPIHPGASFGSIVANGVAAIDRNAAFRFDLGFESVGLNGGGGPGTENLERYFAGFGAVIRVPISPALAFVSGRTGAVQFGHFNNIGDAETGAYLGSSLYTEGSSDNVVISGGTQGSSTILGINLPVGLLMQLDPHLALTLQAGYSVLIEFPSGRSTDTLHFIPLALEAVATPSAPLDIGLRFFLDGQFAATGVAAPTVPYLSRRALMLWFRIRTG